MFDNIDTPKGVCNDCYYAEHPNEYGVIVRQHCNWKYCECRKCSPRDPLE